MQRLILIVIFVLGVISPKAMAFGSDKAQPETVVADSCPTFEEMSLLNEQLKRLIKENVLPSLQYFPQKNGERRIVMTISDTSYGKSSEKQIFKIDAYHDTDADWSNMPDIRSACVSKTENATIFIIDRAKGTSKYLKKTGHTISLEPCLWKKYDSLHEDNPVITIRGYIYPDRLELIEAHSIVNFPFLTFY